MKTFLLGLLSVCLVSMAGAQLPGVPPALVSTTGTAEIRVVPDLADLYFSVETRNNDLEVARKGQAERATKLLAALRAAGVIDTELQTSQVQIAANYSEGGQETAAVRFFRVSQTIGCTLHDLKQIPEVTAKAIAAGATGVSDAALRTSQLRQLRDQARVQAIRTAREKAVGLTRELGVRVGKPYSISESGDEVFRGMKMNSMMEASPAVDDGATPAFAAGTISITANVSASFLLE